MRADPSVMRDRWEAADRGEVSFLIRTGVMAEVDAMVAPRGLKRGSRVLVRTPRGVELAEVIGERPAVGVAGKARDAGEARDDGASADRAIRFLRETTAEDEWLLKRLERHKRRAVEECRRTLLTAGSRSVLLDVDPIFDGGTIVLHFLGPIDDIAEAATRQIVERYESVVRVRDFAKLLNAGCGPGCGTEEGGGCGSGSGGCGGCSLASVCRVPGQRDQSTSVRV